MRSSSGSGRSRGCGSFEAKIVLQVKKVFEFYLKQIDRQSSRQSINQSIFVYKWHVIAQAVINLQYK